MNECTISCQNTLELSMTQLVMTFLWLQFSNDTRTRRQCLDYRRNVGQFLLLILLAPTFLTEIWARRGLSELDPYSVALLFLYRNATIASETSASVGVQTACSLQVPFAVKWELIWGWYTGPSWVGCVLHLVGYSEDEPLRVDAVPVMHHIALCLVAIIYIHQGAESIICIVINNIVFIRCRSC